MKIIIFILLLTSFNCYAIEHIDEQSVLDFLEKEKSFSQSKNIDGVMSLFSDDYSGTNKNGSPETREDLKKSTIATFFNASKILQNSRIKSLTISKDKKSAEAIIENETKFLIEIGTYKTVESRASTTKSLLTIDNGIIKYKNNSYIKAR